jgi:hypothetical protein
VLTLLAFVVFSVATLSSWGAGGILAVVVAAVDAFKVAERIRRGEVVGDWQWF